MGVISQSWLTSRSYGAKAAAQHNDGISPTVSLMYKVVLNVITYIAYADSLEQGRRT